MQKNWFHTRNRTFKTSTMRRIQNSLRYHVIISKRTLCSNLPPPKLAAPTSSEIRKQGLPILFRVSQHASSNNDRILSLDWERGGDETFRDVLTYQQALNRSTQITNKIQEYCCRGNNVYQSSGIIASLCVPGWEYICTQWGIWGAGKASVPLDLTQQLPEIEHVLQDTQPELIIIGGNSSMNHQKKNGDPLLKTSCPPNENFLLKAAENVGLKDRVVSIQDIMQTCEQENATLISPDNYQLGYSVALDDPALILYTSGTTGKPKGVVSTHRNIYHQVTDLVTSWEWKKNDIALHVLPLHHVHGVINVLTCAAYAGASLDFRRFDAIKLWKQWAEDDSPPLTVFMAVPTIYAKLLEASASLPPALVKTAVERTLCPMRLMVSGSAALPVSLLERWKNLTGHTLLERYGMTEFGMALSNPYQPESQRHAGHVGKPLPSVDVKIKREDNDGHPIDDKEGRSGALFVKGDTVFREYLNRPDATRQAFDNEGYFDTGDVALWNPNLNSYRILGRASVDILKVGGHKLSALEIEQVLLEHPLIAEVVVIGLPDDTWGEQVAMIARLKEGGKGSIATISLQDIREWCQGKISKHKIPSRLLLVYEIPKNAMGKVNKKNLMMNFNQMSNCKK